ncbi:MAG: hypothetical protein PHU65_06795 [Actinomycetota bacterium]|nr:hypothetical protein [Actinomycetota bacterium]
MAEKTSKNTLIVAECSFEYSSSPIDIIARGEARAEVSEEEIIIFEKLKQPYIFKLTDISKIIPSNYKIIIRLSPNGEIRLSELGYNFEDFLRILIKSRNMLISKYLLMNEEVIRKDIKAHCEFSYTDSSETINDECEVIVYKTGLAIHPEYNELLRIPYCEVSDISEIDYGILIVSEDNIKVRLNQFGYELDSFKKCLFGAIEELNLFAQKFVRSIDPHADIVSLRKIAGMFLDGKAAMKQDIEKYSKKVWEGLEKLIDKSGLKEEYRYLKTLAVVDKIAIGLKQGLMGELTDDYLWFLIPVLSIDAGNYKNRMILEAVPLKKESPGEAAEEDVNDNESSGEDNISAVKNLFQDILSKENEQSGNGQDEDIDRDQDQNQCEENSATGMATYLFKIFDENETESLKNDSQNARKTELKINEMIRKINKALIAINFRREPIYLSEDALYDPKNIRYRFAIENIPALKELRSKFIGRVSHSGLERWKKSIEKMIKSGKN